MLYKDGLDEAFKNTYAGAVTSVSKIVREVREDMLNLNSLLVFSENPALLVAFYKKVLQKEPDWTGGQFSGFQVGEGMLTIGPHSKVKGKSTQPERIMFNFETDDVQSEFNRIKGLGAVVVAQPYHPSEEEGMLIATFADPDGNYFQLVSPMSMAN